MQQLHSISSEQWSNRSSQSFPKGTDLSVHSEEHLNAVAREFNERRRKTLKYL